MQVTDEEELLFTKATEALVWGNTRIALEQFRKLVAIERLPVYCSNLAFCLAKEKRDFKQAIALCNEAIKNEPKKSTHFLNLGRVYLLAGQKKDAIRFLRMGLRYERNREIITELEMLGARKKPPIPFLNRGNPMNKYLGIILGKMGMRR
jgi:tetratricopeptide (TPR) repeat protein